MMKRWFTALCCMLLMAAGLAQKPYKVAFYNLENFFDTIDDPGVLDEEFTPASAKRWNTAKYTRKLSNVERVLFDIAATDRIFPAVIGFSEVENRSVLEDIVSSPRLAGADYRIVHYDSPDARGVDVAFIYRPAVFRLEGSRAVATVVPQLPNFRTRDILTMWGTIDSLPFYFMVAHWPSRLGGKEASEFKRVAVGEQMRRLADSVLRADPATRVIAMGDFNDDPSDPSVEEALGARGRIRDLAPGDFFNPFAAIHRAGAGTLAYGDRWNLFDNIVVSANMVDGSDGGMRLVQAPGSKYYGTVFRRPYMVQQQGQFKGYPLRTYVGNNFQGGFSDHFPVYVYFAR